MKRKSTLFAIVFVMTIVFVAIIASVAFFVQGMPDITATPSSVSVTQISGEYYLLTDYCEGYSYNFVIEQKLDNDYIYLCDETTSSNILELSKLDNLQLRAGANYRFKVAYSSENGNVGEYSDYYSWTYTDSLDDATFTFSDGILSWTVSNATSFELFMVYPNGSSETLRNITTATLDMTAYDSGIYNVYLTASASGYNSSITYYTFEID